MKLRTFVGRGCFIAVTLVILLQNARVFALSTDTQPVPGERFLSSHRLVCAVVYRVRRKVPCFTPLICGVSLFILFEDFNLCICLTGHLIPGALASGAPVYNANANVP